MFERSSGFPYFLQFKSEFGNKEFSCLVTSNLPWFMDLTFQVPMQYCSLQHWTLLLSPVTSTTGYCFCFGSILSFFLELFLHWSPVAYWAPTDLVNPLSVSYHFSFSYSSWSSQGKNTEVVCHCLLQWTTLCQRNVTRKDNVKVCSNHRTIALNSHASKVRLKFYKPGFSNAWMMNFQMFKLVLEKAEETEI